MMNNSSSSCSSVIRAEASDEEIILLASSKPKKRAGRKKFKETRHPVYRGVRRRNNDKWVCELREPNTQKRIWLGSYPTAEMAARAHDVAALALRGNLATLNFADSAWRLQVPVSKDPKDLRQAAARAAEAFWPGEETDVNSRGAANAGNGHEEMKAATEENAANNCMQNVVTAENVLYSNSCGEVGMFGTQEWQTNMEEGSLLSPNPCLLGSCFSWDDDVESNVEVSLWSYSI
ncbi:PREDICTED: dehydration-responsive element-binding protein 1E-like [Nicotiana attenuata]|uniref:Dehydration-responsive element-binding protein 1f n=1 Tax=Nicotiana attenuata TaxID=49451 RepID=A0A314KMZ1_NICAT|nr:PREDICTED: dehydration-responsive element-binding protein 1E-like [Nicotiana attenuata]OIT30658.1 dehydration-responsive element-binding protein 1f [Nicotiana attenuata]